MITHPIKLLILFIVVLFVFIYFSPIPYTERVGGHVFYIPKGFLLNKSIIILPASREEGFIFKLDPKSNPVMEVTVLIQPRSSVCRSGLPIKSIVYAACSRYDYIVDRSFTKNLIKIAGNSPFEWNYAIIDNKSNNIIPIISCDVVRSPWGNRGHCMYIRAYRRDIIYTVRFDEQNIPIVPVLTSKAEGFLEHWERK